MDVRGSRRAMHALLALAVAMFLPACGPSTTKSDHAAVGAPLAPTTIESVRRSQELEFVDRAADAGVHFAFHSGSDAEHYTILEGNGGGVGIFDMDGDGRLDLYFTGGGGFTKDKQVFGVPGELYRNIADWSFQSTAAKADVSDSPFYSQGCAVGDYDNDGFADLTVYGYQGVQLLRNLGDGTFEDVHKQALIEELAWANAAGWGDLNGDGNLDLFLVRYVDWSFDNHPSCVAWRSDEPDLCGPKRFRPVRDHVYFSLGQGEFKDSTDEAGLRPDGMGMGVVLADVDDNGSLDVYVANDAGPNFLYLNDGHGVMDEVGIVRGVALDDTGGANGSMGVDVFDYDGDGKQDIWVANFEREPFCLYRNLGPSGFVCVSRTTGITALNDSYVGWGTIGADFDRDGDEDIVVANGNFYLHPHNGVRAQPTVLLRNDRPEKIFVPVDFPSSSYLGGLHHGRGLAGGDLDRDGDLDIVVSNLDEPAAVLENKSETKGTGFSAKLIGRIANRDAVGARLTLHTTHGDQVRQVKGGGSYCSQSDLSVFWGVPSGATVTGLTVVWPSGTRHDVRPVAGESFLTIIEPDHEPDLGAPAYQEVGDRR